MGENGSQLSAKGFGVEVSARGALVVIVILIAVMSIGLGFLIHKSAERLEKAIWGAQGPGYAIMEHDRRSTAVTEKLTEAISRLACAQWYAPDEKKAVRRQIQENPALEKLWCP